MITDRSQGAASFGDGNIDLMLHRRCFHDDSWGVEESLDEPGVDGRGLVINGKHLLQLGKSSSDYRPNANRLYNEPMLAFAAVSSPETIVKNYTTMVRI